MIESSKAEYLRIIEHLCGQGAEAVILGCTEIGMLVNQTDTHVELCDTTAIHAAKAVEYAISASEKAGDVTDQRNPFPRSKLRY